MKSAQSLEEKFNRKCNYLGKGRGDAMIGGGGVGPEYDLYETLTSDDGNFVVPDFFEFLSNQSWRAHNSRQYTVGFSTLKT